LRIYLFWTTIQSPSFTINFFPSTGLCPKISFYYIYELKKEENEEEEKEAMKKEEQNEEGGGREEEGRKEGGRERERKERKEGRKEGKDGDSDLLLQLVFGSLPPLVHHVPLH
jgi:hypothetical protein